LLNTYKNYKILSPCRALQQDKVNVDELFENCQEVINLNNKLNTQYSLGNCRKFYKGSQSNQSAIIHYKIKM